MNETTLAFFFMPFDIFILPGLILGIYAQMKLMNVYRRYIREPASRGLSGAEAARSILDAAGLADVSVRPIPGALTDHYDPTRRTLFLSQDNFYGRSLAALGVAAHEAGHALQHQAAYAPLQLRMALVPATALALSSNRLVVGAAGNVLVVCMVPFFFQGMGITSHMMKKMRFGPGMRFAVYALIIGMFGIMIVPAQAALGVLDIWLDFRKQKKPGARHKPCSLFYAAPPVRIFIVSFFL